MHKLIFVVDADEESCQEICEILQQHHYQTAPLHSLLELEGQIAVGSCQLVILDFDSIPVDNRFFRGFRKHNPDVQIVGLSKRSFHPELEEAMSQHISSCLNKPVDEDELLFWVKSLLVNNQNS